MTNQQYVWCDQVLAISTYPSSINNMEVYIDNGVGKTRNLLHLNLCSLTSSGKKYWLASIHLLGMIT